MQQLHGTLLSHCVVVGSVAGCRGQPEEGKKVGMEKGLEGGEPRTTSQLLAGSEPGSEGLQIRSDRSREERES